VVPVSVEDLTPSQEEETANPIRTNILPD